MLTAFRNVFRALGSLLPRRTGPDAAPQRVVRPWREDYQRTYPTVGLTPARALAFLQQADAGAPQVQFELFAEMLQKWPRLAAVESTRRLALTGLDWDLGPPRAACAAPPDPLGPRKAASTPDPIRVADHCRQRLLALDGFHDALRHLASAIGYGIAVAELVWERSELVDVVPVPHARLMTSPDEPWRLRVRIEEEPAGGVPLDAQPYKWIVHRPQAAPGRALGGGLLRASVLLYVAQNLSFKDWLIFSQIAGMPLRIAQFEPGTPEGDKSELLRMLQSVGTDAVAVFSKNIDLKFVEAGAGRGERPYLPLQDYCNKEITIVWLGQNLTTDVGNQGSRAAAEVHDRVREDLLIDDIASEARCLRRDLLRPLVLSRFGPDAPLPEFRRSLIESVDLRVLGETLATAVNQLGVRVPVRWAHRALGIPEPADEEAVLGGKESRR